jgi:alkanesulfonate monooxygenase SsuD/methylene tetrahydromethanopterin reductase-like flavin-dependent oxidoreductase (luciferase family)
MSDRSDSSPSRLPASPASPAPLGRWPESKRPMGIGFMMPISDLSAYGGTPRFRDMVELTRVGEELGYDAAWIPDHFVVRNPDTPIRGVWEGWTTLAGIAAATSTITLGVFVTCVGWRNPGIVAKMAENLDEISNGRFILGLGAGWHEPEYTMFGMPFDYRVSRFDDAIKIINPLLREGRVTHKGDYFSADDAVNLPRGPRGAEGGPPILVGTNGPRMMRLTAQYADAWNSDWHHDTSSVLPALARLDEACADVGRDPKTLIRSAGSNIAMPGYLGVRPNPIVGEPEYIANEIAKFRDIGLKHYVAGLDPCTPKSLEQFARIMELLD